MQHLRTALLLALLSAPFAALAQSDPGDAVQSAPPADPVLSPESGTTSLPPLPAIPRGRSTVLGGAIRGIDPVRDRFTLQVVKGRPLRILFDERTQLFKDGTKVPLRELGPAEHASIETLLDGTDVFAVSIHVLSSTPEGELEGQILSYAPGSGELLLNDQLSRSPVRLRVPASTAVVPQDQQPNAPSTGGLTLADLVPGSLVAVRFVAGGGPGSGIASEIRLLANPGQGFTFRGEVLDFDLHANLLLLTVAGDQQPRSVSLDPGQIPAALQLRAGAHVAVRATFDGTRYIATSLVVE